MTNHWVVYQNADLVFVMGAARRSPSLWLQEWVIEAKKNRKAKLVVVDPRFNRTADGAFFPRPVPAFPGPQRDDPGGPGMARPNPGDGRCDDHNMPEQGKYNGGQKALFWALSLCVLLLTLSGDRHLARAASASTSVWSASAPSFIPPPRR